MGMSRLVMLRRIVLPSGGAGAETDHVLGHELVHAYQFDIARKIEETLNFPGQIRVTVIRETRAVEYAK